MLRNPKSSARYRFIGIALFMSVFAVACVPARIGASWAALRTVGDRQDILVAFRDRVVLVEPTRGDQVELKNEDGSPRVNADNQVMKWEVTGEADSHSEFYSAPVLIDDNTLLIASHEGKFFKVALADGNIKRAATVFTATLTGGGGCSGDCILADVAVDGDQAFVPLTNKDLASVDLNELTPNWRFQTGHGIWSKPVVSDGVVYFTSLDHFLYALDAQTGQEIWPHVDLEGAAPGSPVVDNGRIFVGSLARKIFAVSVADGRILDSYQTEDWVWGSLAVVDGVLYAADLSGQVYALQFTEDRFEESWKHKIAAVGIRPAPLVVGDQIVVASRDGKVYWLDRATGAVRGEQELGAEILSDLLVVQPNDALKISEPLVIVSTVSPDKLLVALTLEGRQQLWKYPR